MAALGGHHGSALSGSRPRRGQHKSRHCSEYAACQSASVVVSCQHLSCGSRADTSKACLSLRVGQLHWPLQRGGNLLHGCLTPLLGACASHYQHQCMCTTVSHPGTHVDPCFRPRPAPLPHLAARNAGTRIDYAQQAQNPVPWDEMGFIITSAFGQQPLQPLTHLLTAVTCCGRPRLHLPPRELTSPPAAPPAHDPCL